jgi:hypothetical protein
LGVVGWDDVLDMINLVRIGIVERSEHKHNVVAMNTYPPYK